MPPPPPLKTLDEFCRYYEADTPANKLFLFKQYEFANKERERLRAKQQRSREKGRLLKATLPPVPKKKPGPKGPWKHRPDNLPATDTA